jgi:hypothetical protein
MSEPATREGSETRNTVGPLLGYGKAPGRSPAPSDLRNPAADRHLLSSTAPPRGSTSDNTLLPTEDKCDPRNRSHSGRVAPDAHNRTKKYGTPCHIFRPTRRRRSPQRPPEKPPTSGFDLDPGHSVKSSILLLKSCGTACRRGSWRPPPARRRRRSRPPRSVRSAWVGRRRGGRRRRGRGAPGRQRRQISAAIAAIAACGRWVPSAGRR